MQIRRFTTFIFALFVLLSSPLNHAQVNPHVIIRTNVGNITLELYPDRAPKTVANFLKYVDEGFYNSTIVHRVVDNFVIQGGGFTAQYEKKPTRPPILNEAINGLKNLRGTVAMARTPEPHSASSQFFINVADNDFLDHTNKTPRGYGYAVFGKVISGMDIVDQINKMPTGAGGPFQSEVPQSPVVIISIERVASAPAVKPN